MCGTVLWLLALCVWDCSLAVGSLCVGLFFGCWLFVCWTVLWLLILCVLDCSLAVDSLCVGLFFGCWLFACWPVLYVACDWWRSLCVLMVALSVFRWSSGVLCISLVIMFGTCVCLIICFVVMSTFNADFRWHSTEVQIDWFSIAMFG